MDTTQKDEYLPDFVKESVEKIRLAEFERKENFRKNLPSYIWNGVVCLIEIGIVAAIFDSLYSGSETIIAAGILVVYVSIRTLGLHLGMAIQSQGLALANEIFQIKTKLGVPQEEDTMDKIKEGNRQFRKLETNSIIRSIGLVILFIMALLQFID